MDAVLLQVSIHIVTLLTSGTGVAMGWLCALVIGVFIFALVGHAIWWAITTAFREIFLSTTHEPIRVAQASRELQSCPACGAECIANTHECEFCDFHLNTPQSRSLRRVRVAQTEVESLAEAGDLDPEVAKSVTAQLTRRARLIQGLLADPAKPVPTPEPAPTVPPIAEPAPTLAAVVPVLEAISQASASVPTPPTESATPEPPTPPQRGSVLAAFMEERNILWGELVGGLLIVGCSIALLVTLWHRLEAFPYFPFLLSGSITLTLYAAGQYTLHHWKLTATSLGLLVISLLLAPLDLLLLTDPITRGELSLPLDVGVKILAVLAFAWVVRGGSRDVLTAHAEWRWWLALAVVGPPAAQLLPGAWLAAGAEWLALACFAAPCVLILRRLGNAEHLERATGTALLQFVGLALFALVAAWGLHLARSPVVAMQVVGLAVPLVLVGTVMAELGLAVALRVREGGPRVVGSAVGLLGVVVMTGGLACGWVQPLSVLVGPAIAGAYFHRTAFAARIPAAIGLAVPAFALAVAVAWFGLVGRWNEPLASVLGTSECGAVLAAFALTFGVLAEVLARRRFAIGPVAYALGAVGVGFAGLFLVSANGTANPTTAAVVHAACAIGLIAANARWRLRVLAHGGLWLILIGSLWALFAAAPERFEKWAFVVSLEALAFGLLARGLKALRHGTAGLMRRAGRDVSIAATVLAPVLMFASDGLPLTTWDTGTLFVLAAAGLALAGLTGAALSTYFAAIAGFLGFVHLAAVTSESEPALRALLIGTLTHATITMVLAVRWRRLERVFAKPLRTSAMLASLAGGVVLLAPPTEHTIEWVGCAVWLAGVWLMAAIVWRDRSAFSVSQCALALAAVLCGVAWLNTLDTPPRQVIAYFRHPALHVYAISLGLLGLGWAVARHRLRWNPLAQHLWTEQPWSAERVTLAVVVVGQFLFALSAIVPELHAELTPLGWTFQSEQPELARVFGSGVWGMLCVVAVTLLASWRLAGTERDTDAHLGGLLVVFLSVPIVWAGTHASETASASALRWSLGVAFVLGTAVVSLRSSLRHRLTGLGFPYHPSAIIRQAVPVTLAVVAGVVVLLSVKVAELALTGLKPSGPDPGSLFAAMGPLLSNVVPLLLVVVGLACSALRERSPAYAFTGGLVFTATLAAGYAVGVVTAGDSLDGTQQLRIGLIVSSAASLWAILWLAAERRVTGGMLLAVQVRLGLGVLATISASAAGMLFRSAGPLPAAWADVGQFGWLALLIALGATLRHSARNEPHLKFHVIALSAAIAGVLAACAVQPWDASGQWLSFHLLGCAWAVLGIGLALAVQRRVEASLWLDGMTVVLVLFALRGRWHGPWQPWMSVTLASVAAFVMGTSAVLNRSGVRVAVSGLCVNFAAILLWLPLAAHTHSGFLLANAAGLAAAAAIWTRVSRRNPEANWQALTDIARGVSLVLLWFGLLPTFAGTRTDPVWLTWGATVIAAGSLLASTAEATAKLTRIGLFAASAAMVLLAVGETTSRSVWAVWQTPVALTAYAVFHAVCWATTRHATKFIPRPPRQDACVEGLAGHAILATTVLVLAVRNGLVAPELTERLASAFAVLLLVGAAALLQRAVPTFASVLRYVCVALGAMVFASAAWAVPDPAGLHPWLHRNAWLFVSLIAVGVVGTELASRLGENWRGAAKRIGGLCAACAVLVLGVNLVQQVPVFDPVAKHTPLGPPAVLSMLAGIFACIVLAIHFALRQDRDPLGLPTRNRTIYVYLAELLVVLFFTHIRFNVPELFLAGAVQYWMFAVMAIAFVVVGLAELFERRKLDVLATPLRRTGVLVPLIPLLAFWAKPPAFLTTFATNKAPGLSPLLGYLEKLPQEFNTYAWLWFLAGGLYGLVALARNSFGWALLAALATNAALWSLLTHHQVPFAVHPQAWVIPFALIVLVSEHINRARLSTETSNGLRYLGVGMIYVASSADMFLAGVGQSVLLPVLLAVLCVIGVLAGMLMRVRPFVFLGIGFLLLDIFAMIWHAAVDLQQTWVWYVSGIVLGVAILGLFAVFEKRKRQQDT
ncbi:MAG: hypothetical protein C0467_09035 [Planctomycetaceae bacterium]|nr:hypothetical protein [Planctomycetaceae bacterium]